MNKIQKKLIDNSVPVPHAGCWLWLLATDHEGYGLVKLNRVMHRAHRESYKQFVGDIPKRYFVCHTCDNPTCINPDHLFAGSPQDNMTDKVNKNRQALGHQLKQSNLTDQDVLDIV